MFSSLFTDLQKSSVRLLGEPGESVTVGSLRRREQEFGSFKYCERPTASNHKVEGSGAGSKVLRPE